MNKYGLIGKKLEYSFSKIIHEYLIEEFNIDASYNLIETDNLDLSLINSYKGLNITTPYKQDIVKYINDNSGIGVCNVVYKNQGYNVDIDGFMYLYNKLYNVENTTVLGKGACAKLIENNIKNCITIETLNKTDFNSLNGDLLVNATPKGMGSYEAIVGEEVIKNFKRVIDLNYNPLNSKLKYLCYKNNVEYIGGIEMLIVQAIKSFEIFNQIKVSEEYIQKILVVVLKQLNLNIALIGMPLAGKSTICKKYNGVDIDDEISKNYKIEDLIKNESEFRKVEAQIIKGNLDKRFICLGGGAVKTAKNLELLKNHLIIFLDENLEVLENRYLTKVRPLLKSKEDVSKLYNERIKLYNNFCNIKFSYSKLEEFLNEYFNN